MNQYGEVRCDMSKKIAIVTWIKYYNFGTFLQAYALQAELLKLGYDPCLLDDRTIVEEGRQVVSRSNVLKRLYYSCRQLLIDLYRKGLTYYLKEKQSIRLYNRFRHRYLNVDMHIQPLSALDERYDVFVCGSDQIWYPSSMIFSPYYYLGFTQKKKIAYAPSMGTSRYPEIFKPKVKPLWDRFYRLSVREQIGADIVGSIVGKKVPAVLDPTLLLDRKDWEELVTENTFCKQEYVLCYLLTYNETYIHFVVDYARRHSLQIVSFALVGQRNDFANKLLTAGPREFLSAIKYAKVVFTDSFHATIFSLHFRKMFYTFKRFADDDPNNQNSRVNNLLQLVELQNHFVSMDNLKKLDCLPAIDYDKVELKLLSERNKSIQYLKEALED